MKKAEPTKDLYNENWSQWDDMKQFGPASRHVRRLVLQQVSKLTFRNVADIGCGVGTLLADIHSLYPKVTLTGTELFAQPLKRAQQRLPQAKFQTLDLVTQKLPQTYDLTLCIDVLEHINDDTKAMKHLREMTNGHAIIVVPLGPLFEVERVRVGHVHGYSRKEFDQKLSAAGFTIISSYQWGFPFYNLYRRLLHRLPEATTTGQFSGKKKLISTIIYYLLFLNLFSKFGERYLVVCKTR